MAEAKLVNEEKPALCAQKLLGRQLGFTGTNYHKAHNIIKKVSKLTANSDTKIPSGLSLAHTTPTSTLVDKSLSKNKPGSSTHPDDKTLNDSTLRPLIASTQRPVDVQLTTIPTTPESHSKPPRVGVDQTFTHLLCSTQFTAQSDMIKVPPNKSTKIQHSTPIPDMATSMATETQTSTLVDNLPSTGCHVTQAPPPATSNDRKRLFSQPEMQASTPTRKRNAWTSPQQPKARRKRGTKAATGTQQIHKFFTANKQ